ncbi:MAG: MFS transporter [Mycobacterium leprae]
MSRRNARSNVLNAVAGSIAFGVINQYIGIFAVKLNATDLQLGYLSSWPNFASVIAVIGAATAVARSKSKQKLIAAILFAGRAAFLGAAAVPWFPPTARVWALIGFWVVAVFPASAAGTALSSFLADVFPTVSERGKAFAARNAWATGAGMLSIPVVGWLLDYVFPYPEGYQIVFAASFLVALVELYYLLKLEEPAKEEDPGKAPGVDGGLKAYLRTFRHRPFLLFVLCSIPFHFTWQLAWPIFTRYQVTDLGMNNEWMAWTTVANQLGQVLTYPVWARMAERYGNLRMLWLATINVALAPFLTAWAPSLWWLIPVNVITGVGVAGLVLLILNSQLDVSPAEERPVFLAVHSALVSISATIAPLAGAFLMASLGDRLALFISSGPRLIASSSFLVLFWYNRRTKGRAAAVNAGQ